MSARVLLDLLNEFEKRDKMRGLHSSYYCLFHVFYQMKNSEYDQEIPQSQTADEPVAS